MKKILAVLIFLICTPVFAQDPGVVPNIFGQTYADDAYIRYGNSRDSSCGFNTAQTPDSLVCGVDATSNALIIMQQADLATDAGLSTLAYPNLSILGADPTDFIRIGHNGTSATVTTSSGPVVFTNGIYGANSSFGAEIQFEGATIDGFQTTLTVVDPTVDRTITLPNDSGTVTISGDCTSVVSGEFNPTEAQATDDYLNLVDNTFSATVGDEDMFMVPLALQAHSLRADVDVAPGSGDSWVITLIDDTAPSTLTCTIDDTNTTCSDAVNSPTLAAGSRLAVLVDSGVGGSDPDAAAALTISFCLGQ